MGILQIEHLKDRVICGLVLTLDNGVVHAAFLDTLIVLEDSLAMKTDPCIFGRRYGYFDLGICKHILINILCIIGAEPELSVLLEAEHERTALCLSVTSYGC